MWEGVLLSLSIGAMLVGAVLWLLASWVRVDPGWRPGTGRSEPFDPVAANADWTLALLTAAKRSGRLNAWAAGVTGGGAMLQAFSLIAHHFGV